MGDGELGLGGGEELFDEGVELCVVARLVSADASGRDLAGVGG